MRDLLYLTHRLPYPPNKGDKIRSYHILRYLQQHYRVHLGTFVDDARDERHAGAVADGCASSCIVRLRPHMARWRSLGALASGEALSLTYYRSRRLQHWVQATLAAHPIDVALAFSGPMAQYLPAASARGPLWRVMDLVDVDSEKWRAYAGACSDPWKALHGSIYRREARLLGHAECAIARSFDRTVLVSPAEAALLQQRAPDCARRIACVANGVDSSYFSPQDELASPYHDALRSTGNHDGDQPLQTARHLVFTGALDYLPNRTAAGWFARAVLPLLRSRCGDVRLHIVGARPANDVLALRRLAGVSVHANVPDVRPYLQHAALAVAPMLLARGVQNKVLEAMAMAKTVVVTPAALEGINAVAGKELLVASNAADFISCIADALAAPPHCGAHARRRVLEDYCWQRNLERLGAALLPGGQARAQS